jgi:MinD-like ATPase involved in chromosome partitioning or flagellar assembly
MKGHRMATGITLLAGSGGCGRTTTASGLAARLAETGRSVLLFDLCFGWTGLNLDRVNLPTYQKLLGSEESIRELVVPTSHGFDLLTTIPPRILSPERDELESITRLINNLARHYDFLILDPPSGAQPLGMLAAGLSDNILLLARPDAATVASSYCLLKTLVGEGLSDRVKVAFGFVNSPEHAASLKTKFDLLTEQFLNLKLDDGGFIYNNPGLEFEDFHIDRSTEELLILARNLRLDRTRLFQNETVPETMGEVHQKQF